MAVVVDSSGRSARPSRQSEFPATMFSAREYNRTYFSSLMQDEERLLGWLADSGRAQVTDLLLRLGQRRVRRLLDVGAGPTVHHLFALVDLCDDIVVSDYLFANLSEIRNWLDHHPDAHDWSEFARATHSVLGAGYGPPDGPSRLEADVRSVVSRLLHIDLTRPWPMGRQAAGERFDLVTSFFCADSATDSHQVFTQMMANLASLVADGGLFLASFLGGCSGYRVGSHELPSADLDAATLQEALVAAGLEIRLLERIETPEMVSEGFDHIFAAACTKD